MRQRILAGIILSLMAATTNAALLGRIPLTPGGTDYQAYFDDVLNITWQANANLADTNDFGVAGIDVSGYMNWYTAQTWIAAMNAATYLGASNWRLPNTDPVNGVSYNYADSYDGSTDDGYNISAPDSAYPGATGSEIAHLHYTTLGNIGLFTTASNGETTDCGTQLNRPTCVANPGPFINLTDDYWSITEYGAATTPGSRVWGFDFDNGRQYGPGKTGNDRAWAVADGDPLANTVPIPAAVWLLGSALGVIGVMRRRAAG